MKNTVKILNTNNYSINLKSDFNNLEKINSYYPTFTNMRLLDKILTSIDNKSNGSIILSGAYGTGKSYFTAILLNILNSSSDIKIYENLIKKSKKIYDIEDGIKRVQDKKYIPIFIDDSYQSFSEGVFSGIKKAMSQYNLNIEIPSSFEIITKKLKTWEKNYPMIYKNFQEKLEKYNFFQEVKYKTKKSQQIFSSVYSEIFAGEQFNWSGEIKNITNLLKEVESGVIKNGYSGVIYIFDEFGRYLETNIHNLDVKEIQDMAEYCNQENNSNLFMITHKDLFQYSRKVKTHSEQEEWEKVSGRFLKEHLVYEKTNVLEIIKNIIKKNNYTELKKTNINIQRKEKLLSNIISTENNEKITEDFYPLDYITATILPDLSQKLAQNERTLFAFICSDEEKALRNLIENSEDEYFITLDKLYDYFEKELRQLPVDSAEYKLYMISKDLLSKLNNNEEIEKKIIKTLALIYINNNFSEIEPNFNTLKYIFNNENLNLEHLESKKFITLKKYLNHYKLVENLEFNLEDEIEKYKETKLGKFNYVERLEKELELGPYYPLKYNDTYKIIRYFGQYYVDISDISRIEELNKNKKEDGKIIYLTNIEKNPKYAEIINLITEKYDDIFICGNDNANLDITTELKELEIIFQLENSDHKYNKNEIFKYELEQLRKDIRKVLKIKVQNFFYKKIDLLNFTNTYLEKKYPKFIKINYELINKHILSAPMKKSRLEILKKLENSIELDNKYFNDTKAESSVARILLKNTGLYFRDRNNPSYHLFKNLKESILKDIKKERTPMTKIYEKYCSNIGEYGFREGIFTFILGLLFVENKEFITLSTAEDNSEILLTLDILDSIEKNPEKYSISYYKINDIEISYMNKLEHLFKEYISLKEKKIYNRILTGVKNYLLYQPRYISNIYLHKTKGLNKIFRGIFTVNNGKDFVLKELLKIYKTDNYDDIISSFEKELTMIDQYKSEFQDSIKKVTLYTLTQNDKNTLHDLFNILIEKNVKNEVEEFILNLKTENEEYFLKEITKKIKGFSYDNWRTINDINEYEELLKNEMGKVTSQNINSEKIKIIFNEKEDIIDLGVEDTMLGKMLTSKIEATIKNMALSLSEQEKKKILAKILLEI